MSKMEIIEKRVRDKKIPEFPIDTLIYFLFGAGVIFFIITIFVQTILDAPLDSDLNNSLISVFSICIIASWFLLLSPWLSFKRRKKCNLV